ncbi:hypothetical protein IQ255_17660 [Pleurocapsales cyanobacterium LEGE 10410]|nr:hypothetical protein [Pleurocapsales cyanobacterium LEGE 10410]
MENKKKILSLSITINLVLLLTSLKLLFEINKIFKKKPKFIQNTYSHNISETKIEFKNSVKEEFSIGISENQLIKELAELGFKPGWSYNNQHSAVFITSNIACHSVWSVIWKVDDLGNVTKIDGQYRAGCL